MENDLCKMVDGLEIYLIAEFKKQKLMLTDEQRDRVEDLKAVINHMLGIDAIVKKAKEYEKDYLEDKG